VWEIASSDPATALLMVELTAYALRDPELRDLAEGLYDSYQRLAAEEAMRTLVARSDRDLRIPIEEMGRVIVAGFNGLVMSFLVHGDRERGQRDLERLIDSLTAVAVGSTSPSG
jgi:TetR/AcrR family transcriptional regulator, regulator of biofilm formation and stress response